jgi:6-pyruvoyltetrahydropterin/6-carboxytetrahydropterin synthase
MRPRFTVTKTYGHELGLSAAFRQWRSDSHCRYIHGYALSFELTFAADGLDKNNWVIDFGNLKPIKEYLVNSYDHRLIVAQDDPAIEALQELADDGVVSLSIAKHTGCESFASETFEWVNYWLLENHPGVTLLSVTVREHGANAATCYASEDA